MPCPHDLTEDSWAVEESESLRTHLIAEEHKKEAPSED